MKKYIYGFLILSLAVLTMSTVSAAATEELTITKICSPTDCASPDSFPFTITDSNNIISGSFTLNNANNYTKTFSGFQNAQTSTNQQPTNIYSITESIPSDWNAPTIDCGGANIGFDTPTPGKVTFDYTPNPMEPLAHITCTFTNTKKEVVEIDICANLEGNQTTVPAGYTVDAAGKCTPIEKPRLATLNIQSIPAGVTMVSQTCYTTSSGICGITNWTSTKVGNIPATAYKYPTTATIGGINYTLDSTSLTGCNAGTTGTPIDTCNVSVAVGATATISATYKVTPPVSNISTLNVQSIPAGVNMVNKTCYTTLSGICGKTNWTLTKVGNISATAYKYPTTAILNGVVYILDSTSLTGCNNGVSGTPIDKCMVHVTAGATATISATYKIATPAQIATLNITSSPAGVTIAGALTCYTTSSGTCGKTNWTSVNLGNIPSSTYTYPLTATVGGINYTLNSTSLTGCNLGTSGTPINVCKASVASGATATISATYTVTPPISPACEANLVLNPSFETVTGAPMWQVKETSTTQVPNWTRVNSSVNPPVVELNGQSGGGYLAFQGTKFAWVGHYWGPPTGLIGTLSTPTIIGKKYTLSAIVAKEYLSSIATFELRLKNSTSSAESAPISLTIGQSTSWKMITGTLTANDNYDQVVIRFDLNTNGAWDTDGLVDDVHVCEKLNSPITEATELESKPGFLISTWHWFTGLFGVSEQTIETSIPDTATLNVQSVPSGITMASQTCYTTDSGICGKTNWTSTNVGDIPSTIYTYPIFAFVNGINYKLDSTSLTGCNLGTSGTPINACNVSVAAGTSATISATYEKTPTVPPVCKTNLVRNPSFEIIANNPSLQTSGITGDGQTPSPWWYLWDSSSTSVPYWIRTNGGFDPPKVINNSNLNWSGVNLTAFHGSNFVKFSHYGNNVNQKIIGELSTNTIVGTQYLLSARVASEDLTIPSNFELRLRKSGTGTESTPAINTTLTQAGNWILISGIVTANDLYNRIVLIPIVGPVSYVDDVNVCEVEKPQQMNINTVIGIIAGLSIILGGVFVWRKPKL